jgi:outer membrane putative beta-barrel porin/alpha-amylase
MKRVLLHTCLGLAFGCAATAVQADDWRPVDVNNAATSRVQLGKPVSARAASATTSEDVLQASQSRSSPISELELQPTGLIVRGQTPDGTPVRPTHGFGHGYGTPVEAGGAPPTMVIPGSPEEQYNCGVVSEGPATGGPFLGAPSSWLGGIGGFFGSYTNFLSDHAFDNFISPVSNPFFFEDPRSLTELRPIFIYQHATPEFGKTNLEFFAIQARIALTDRWSLTLNKLGYLALQSDSTLLGDRQGLSELDFGIKYTFWRDDVTNTIMALGLQAELPIGSGKVFQDTGSGSLTPYFSFAQQFAQNWHFMASGGYRFRLDSDRSESFFVSGHLDYSIFNRIYPLVEVNWYHVMKNGSDPHGLGVGFEGQDLFNLGTAAKGTDMVTVAAGVRFKITEAAQLGVVFEMPVTSRDDLMKYRITADFILRY